MMELTIGAIAESVSGKVLQGNPRSLMAGISTDSRTISPGEFFIPLKGERFDGHHFIGEAVRAQASGIMVNREWKPADCPDLTAGTPVIEVAETLTALGDLARSWAAHAEATIIAITGSNGKTTTREMTATILEQSHAVLKPQHNWNNLIGLPLTLLRLRPHHQMAVLELGMNRRGEIKRLAHIAQPHIGVITNVGPVHLEYLKTLDEVAQAKNELFESLSSEDYAVINADDPRIAALARRCTAQTLTFGITSSAQVRALHIASASAEMNHFTLVLGQESIPVALKMPGIHSVYNALAAASIAHLCGVNLQEIRTGLEQCRPYAGRMEIIPIEGDITIINDTYNANPTSMEIALRTLAQLKGRGRGIAVLGDMLELGETSAAYHRQLGALIGELKFSTVILTGVQAPIVAASARSGGADDDTICIADNHEEIARQLDQRVQAHDWILFKGSRAMRVEKSLELFTCLRKVRLHGSVSPPTVGMGCNH